MSLEQRRETLSMIKYAFSSKAAKRARIDALIWPSGATESARAIFMELFRHHTYPHYQSFQKPSFHVFVYFMLCMFRQAPKPLSSFLQVKKNGGIKDLSVVLKCYDTAAGVCIWLTKGSLIL